MPIDYHIDNFYMYLFGENIDDIDKKYLYRNHIFERFQIQPFSNAISSVECPQKILQL